MRSIWRFALAVGVSLGGVEAPLAAGPYVEIEGGYASAANAHIRDTHGYLAPGCLICQPGQLNHLDGGGLVGAAAGYRVNEFFRADVKFSYRGGNDLADRDVIKVDYRSSIESLAAMLSGYFDVPLSLGPVKPYVGFGVGWAWNTLSAIHQHWSAPTPGPAGTQTDPGGSNSGFAWQAMFGLSYPFASDWAFDLGYRHFDGGRLKTGGGTSVITQVGLPAFSYQSRGTSGYFITDEVVASLRYSF